MHAATIEETRAQIAVKQAELAIAHNDLTLLQSFADNYQARADRLTNDRQQLKAVRDNIATIQTNNLIKVTLQLGFATANAMNDAGNVAQAASKGVRALALELLNNTLSNEAKKKLGLDDESLTSPITLKIRGLNQIATQKIPEIEAVRKLLGSDLYAIRGQEYQNRVADPNYDMNAPGNDPRYWSDNAAILLKLGNTIKALDTAYEALIDISEELNNTYDDTTINIPVATAKVQELQTVETSLEFLLNDLLNEQLGAKALAAAQQQLDALGNPVASPTPSITPIGSSETLQEYENRRVQAILDAVNAHVTPLILQIDEKMAGYNDLKNQYTALMDPWREGAVNDPNNLGILSIFSSAVQLECNLADYPTPQEVAIAYNDTKRFVEVITQHANAPDAVDAILSEMSLLWQEANTRRMQVQDWVLMAKANDVNYQANGALLSFPNYDYPIEGTAVEEMIVSLDDFVASFPGVLPAATARLGVLHTRFDELNAELLLQIADNGALFEKAETAFDAYTMSGNAADQVLVASGWNTDGISGFRYWGEAGWITTAITHNYFSMTPFTASLLQALASPGTSGITAYQQVMDQYAAMLASFETANDHYHVAYMNPEFPNYCNEAGGLTPSLV